MNHKTWLGIAVVVGSLWGGACGKSREAAATATQEFRQRAAAGHWVSIYKGAAPEFQKSITEADFAKMMTGVSGKLGTWQSSKTPIWNVTAGTGGRTVTLKYESQFEKGIGFEDFLWRIQDGRGILLGYHINSPVFMAN
jgi:hypothetical protein